MVEVNAIRVMAGSGTGTFTVPVVDLSPGTTYHLRATVSPNRRALTRMRGSRTVLLKKQRILVVRAVSTVDSSFEDAASIRVRVRVRVQ